MRRLTGRSGDLVGPSRRGPRGSASWRRILERVPAGPRQGAPAVSGHQVGEPTAKDGRHPAVTIARAPSRRRQGDRTGGQPVPLRPHLLPGSYKYRAGRPPMAPECGRPSDRAAWYPQIGIPASVLRPFDKYLSSTLPSITPENPWLPGIFDVPKSFRTLL